MMGKAGEELEVVLACRQHRLQSGAALPTVRTGALPHCHTHTATHTLPHTATHTHTGTSARAHTCCESG
eukprot:4877781-Pyramimonas_sp.AAC.2